VEAALASRIRDLEFGLAVSLLKIA